LRDVHREGVAGLDVDGEAGVRHVAAMEGLDELAEDLEFFVR
jgi:hypothetical protein